MPDAAMDTGMPDVLFELDNAEESLVLLWNTPKSKRGSRLKESSPAPILYTTTTGAPHLSPSPKDFVNTTPSSTRQFINTTSSLAPARLVTPSPIRRPFSPHQETPSSSIKQSAVLSPRRRISTPKERNSTSPKRAIISPDQSAPVSPRRRTSTPQECPVSPERSVVSPRKFAPRRRIATPKECPVSPKRQIPPPKQLAPLSPRRRVSTPKESPASPRRSITSPKVLAPLSPRRRISTPREDTPKSPKRSVISPRPVGPLSPRARTPAPKVVLPSSPRRYVTTPTQATPLSPKSSVSTPKADHPLSHRQVLTPRTTAVSPNRPTSPLVSSDENFPVSPRRPSFKRGHTEDRTTTPLNTYDDVSPNGSALRRPTFFSASRRSSGSRGSSSESPENNHQQITPSGRRPLLSRRTSSPGNQDLTTPVNVNTHRRASAAVPVSGKRPSFLSRPSPAPVNNVNSNSSGVPSRGTSFHVPSTATPSSGRLRPSFATATPTGTPRNRFSLIRRSPAAPRTPKETSTALTTPGGNNNVLGRSVSKIKPIFNAVASTITSPGSNPIQPLRRSTSMRNGNRRAPVTRRMASFKSPPTATPIEEAEFIAAQLKQKAAYQKAEAADLEEELEAHKLEAAVMEAEADKILCEVRRASHTGTAIRSPSLQAYRHKVTVVKPFHLSSFRKHEEATRRREARVEDEDRELDRRRKFKARPMPTFYRR